MERLWCAPRIQPGSTHHKRRGVSPGFGISLQGSEEPFRFSLAAATFHPKQDARKLHVGYLLANSSLLEHREIPTAALQASISSRAVI